jgi:hypothetical protein
VTPARRSIYVGVATLWRPLVSTVDRSLTRPAVEETIVLSEQPAVRPALNE